MTKQYLLILVSIIFVSNIKAISVSQNGNIYSAYNGSINPSHLGVSYSHNSRFVYSYSLLLGDISVYNLKAYQDMVEEINTQFADEQVSEEEINEFEQVVNDYFKNNAFILNSNANTKLAFIFPLDSSEAFQISINGSANISYQTIADQGVDVATTDVSTLIAQSQITGEQINSSSFVKAIDHDMAFLNSGIGELQLALSYGKGWYVRDHRYVAFGITAKMSQFDTVTEISSYDRVLDELATESDENALESLDDILLDDDSNTDKVIIYNIDLGISVYNFNYSLGLSVENLLENTINFPDFSDTCSNDQNCLLAQKYADTDYNKYKITPKYTLEGGYLSDYQNWYFNIKYDLNSWQNKNLKDSQNMELTLSYRQTSLFSGSNFGQTAPSLTINYVKDVIEKNDLWTILMNIWALNINFSFSTETMNYLIKNGFGVNESSFTNKDYAFAFGIGFSNNSRK